MGNSEHYIQIFLFVATIICYIVLSIFIFYAVYYCLIRSCILRRRRLTSGETGSNKDQDEETGNQEDHAYCGRVQLLNPFQDNEKNKVTIVSNLNTSKCTHPAAIITTENDVTAITLPQHDNSNAAILDEKNSFIDKKYYDIFVA